MKPINLFCKKKVSYLLQIVSDMEKILVTGGAGFIGSHTVDLLIEKGYKVRILDNLEPEIHGNKIPDYLNKKAEFIRGDITNPDVWKKSLKDMDAVIHLAALIYVAQSFYQPFRYLHTNVCGTAHMYEAIINKKFPIEKIIIASSVATYGEGTYECKNCGKVYPPLRPIKQLENKDWEVHCSRCNEYVKPVFTTEDKKQENISIYALSKYNEEKMALNYGFALNIPTAVLRYFNAYGPRQPFNNPYAGVCVTFSSRIKNNKRPLINEDGLQTRDFIYVEDVAKANLISLEKFDGIDAFNIGTGKPVNILEIAKTILKIHDSKLEPEMTGKFRLGDVRHAYGDVSKAKKHLGFEAKTSLKDGLKKTCRMER